MKKRPTTTRMAEASSGQITQGKQDALYRLAVELGQIVGKFLADKALANENKFLRNDPKKD